MYKQTIFESLKYELSYICIIVILNRYVYIQLYNWGLSLSSLNHISIIMLSYSVYILTRIQDVTNCNSKQLYVCLSGVSVCMCVCVHVYVCVCVYTRLEKSWQRNTWRKDSLWIPQCKGVYIHVSRKLGAFRSLHCINYSWRQCHSWTCPSNNIGFVLFF